MSNKTLAFQLVTTKDSKFSLHFSATKKSNTQKHLEARKLKIFKYNKRADLMQV